MFPELTVELYVALGGRLRRCGRLDRRVGGDFPAEFADPVFESQFGDLGAVELVVGVADTDLRRDGPAADRADDDAEVVERARVTAAGRGEEADRRVGELVLAAVIKRVFQRRRVRPVIHRRAKEDGVGRADAALELADGLPLLGVRVERRQVDGSTPMSKRGRRFASSSDVFARLMPSFSARQCITARTQRP